VAGRHTVSAVTAHEGDVIRVAICDDSLGFPVLLGSWLRANDRFEVVGTVDCGERLKDLVAAERPDVVLLDLVLPDVPDPPTLVRDLRESHPPVRVVLMSSMVEDELAREAEAAEVESFMNKSATADLLYATVLRVAEAP
jgi:DNA-binding NarL/FixJ family response regulator